MRAKVDGRELVLSTGTRIDTSIMGTESLTPGDNAHELYYGYDGSADTNKSTPLTFAEREEVAEYMIEVWRRWAAGQEDD